MKWKGLDAALDDGLLGRGRWCRLSEIDCEFPDIFGVFLFTDQNLEVLYIGLAAEGGLRHAALIALDYNGAARGASHATWLATRSADQAVQLMSTLHREYQPTNNR